MLKKVDSNYLFHFSSFHFTFSKNRTKHENFMKQLFILHNKFYSYKLVFQIDCGLKLAVHHIYVCVIYATVFILFIFLRSYNSFNTIHFSAVRECGGEDG